MSRVGRSLYAMRWKPFLLLPVFILAAFYQRNAFNYHSDDFQYWVTAIQWKKLFATESFFGACAAVIEWQWSFPSYHPLIGTVSFWIAGSVEAATHWMAWGFSSVVAFSCYSILREQKIEERNAVFGAVVVATYPYLLGIGQSFLSELPFCAFSLAALAFLNSERFWGFAFFCCLGILVRPFEAIILLPSFYFFYAVKRQSLYPSRAFLNSVICALVFAVLLFSCKYPLIASWFRHAFFATDGTEQSKIPNHPGAENIAYVGRKILEAYGPFGCGIIVVSMFIAWRNRASTTIQGLSHAYLFTVVMIVLGILSTFENWSTRETFGRYLLIFFLFFLLSACSVLMRLGKSYVWMPLLGAFVGYNLFLCGAAVRGPVYPEYLGGRAYAEYSLRPFHFHYFSAGHLELARELEKVIPSGKQGNILMVGRNSAMIAPTEAAWLPLLHNGREPNFSWQFSEKSMQESFALDFKAGTINLRNYGVDAVVFARGKIVPELVNEPLPNELLVSMLESNKPGSVGLLLSKKIEWVRYVGGPAWEVDIYLPK